VVVERLCEGLWGQGEGRKSVEGESRCRVAPSKVRFGFNSNIVSGRESTETPLCGDAPGEKGEETRGERMAAKGEGMELAARRMRARHSATRSARYRRWKDKCRWRRTGATAAGMTERGEDGRTDGVLWRDRTEAERAEKRFRIDGTQQIRGGRKQDGESSMQRG
jgi:hypothetical protein